MAKRPYSLRLDDDVIERVRVAAARRKWTPSFWMAEAIEAALAREEPSPVRPYDGTQRTGERVMMGGGEAILTGARRQPNTPSAAAVQQALNGASVTVGDPDAYRLDVSGRPQAHHWRVIDPNGEVVAEGGPVLTSGAASRKAAEALDDKLGAGNYRLEP